MCCLGVGCVGAMLLVSLIRRITQIFKKHLCAKVFFLFSLSVGFFVVNIREVFFLFCKKKSCVSVCKCASLFCCVQKVFFFLVRVCVIVLRVLFSVRSLWHHIPVTRCEYV